MSGQFRASRGNFSIGPVFVQAVTAGPTTTDGSVSYMQHTDINVDPASTRTPEVLEDAAAILTRDSGLIPVLANDYDLEGGALTIDSVTTPASGGSMAIEDNKIRFTQNGDINGIFYSFGYVVRNATGLTATASVSILGGWPVTPCRSSTEPTPAFIPCGTRWRSQTNITR